MQQILLFYSKEGLIELPYLVGEDFFLYKHVMVVLKTFGVILPIQKDTHDMS